jgi:hypothetical protein
MAPLLPKTAHLNIHPLEPVLVFSTPEDAAKFQQQHKQSRILVSESRCWVFLPLPDGLKRVRTAKGGDVAFEFEKAEQAVRWNREMGEVGRRYRGKDEIVYLGDEKY